MAQTTVLAPATTAGTSSNIDVASGVTKTVGLYVANGPIIGNLAVVLDTPGADVLIGYLTPERPAMVISGPGTFRVVRAESKVAVGAFTEG